MEKIVLFGLGEFAQLIAHYIIHESEHKLAGFTIDREYIDHREFLGHPVVPFDEIETIFPTNDYKILIAIGYTKTNKLREEKYLEVKAKGYKCTNFISSTAIVSEHSSLGESCIILEGVIVQPFAKIGNGVVLWSGCHIGHHSEISNYCFVAPKAAISGNVKVGTRSFIGINATVRDGICVASDCVIGAGAVLLDHTQEKDVYKAIPANLLDIKSNQLRTI